MGKINDLRIKIQTALNTIQNVDSGVPIPDNVVEDGTTYFGYEIQTSSTFETYDKDRLVQIVLTGRVVRVDNPTENTLAIVDDAVDDIVSALMSLNFYCDTQDITIEQNIRKVQVSGTAIYDTLNDTIVI